MFQRIIAWIDALGDRVHPITVLVIGRKGYALRSVYGMLIFQAILFTALYFYPLWSNYINGTEGRHVIDLYSLMFALMPAFISMSFANNNYFAYKKKDPLLFLTPLSDRETLIGFFQTGVITSASAFSTFLLFFAYSYALRLISLEKVLVWLPLGFLAGIPLSAVEISITSFIRTTFQRTVVGVLRILAFLVLGMGITLLTSLPYAPFAVPPIYDSVLRTVSSPLYGGVLFVVAWAALWFTAWRLFEFNLPRERPFAVKLAATMFVYTTVALALVGLTLGLAWFSKL